MKKSRSAKKQDEKPVALTVKISSELYVRLSTYRAKERRTAQEILTEALEQYLDRVRE